MQGPDFIGIGAQKAGTTWLYKQLSKHPEVSMGKCKEINFFNDRYSLYTHHPIKNYKKGIKWYIEQLAPEEGKVNGDISPNYLWDEKAAKRIHKHFPDVKIIVMLRDPIERAYSHFLHANKHFDVGRDFKEAIKHNEFLERGLYFKQLSRYYDLFPRENILVILFSEIRENPEKTLHKVEKFLNIEKYIPNSNNKKVNKAEITKFPVINKTNSKLVKIKKTKLGKNIWETTPVKAIKRVYLRITDSINRTYFEKEPLWGSTKKELYPFFKEDIKKLERLIQRDLCKWRQ